METISDEMKEMAKQNNVKLVQYSDLEVSILRRMILRLRLEIFG